MHKREALATLSDLEGIQKKTGNTYLYVLKKVEKLEAAP